MEIKSFVTVQFKLDEDEKEIMKNALDIMRKFKEKFFTKNMSNHQKQIEECMVLLSDIIIGKEINE